MYIEGTHRPLPRQYKGKIKKSFHPQTCRIPVSEFTVEPQGTILIYPTKLPKYGAFYRFGLEIVENVIANENPFRRLGLFPVHIQSFKLMPKKLRNLVYDSNSSIEIE